MSQKCQIQNCNAWATEDGFCFFHSPQQKGKRLLAQRAGGKVGKSLDNRIITELEPVAISKPQDVVQLLNEVTNLVRSRQIDLKVANTIGNLANSMLKAIELSELEGKVETIERAILERQRIFR